jgi:nucleoside-diphosphate-sugar epimerase
MRILLTGCQGYLGGVLGPRLRAAGHDVVGLDAGWFAQRRFGPQPEPIPCRTIDIRDVTSEDLQGFDAVLHLAALSNDPLGELDPDLTMDINHRASVRLARLARDAGVSRFVFSSSCSTYGGAGEDVVNEESPTNPVTHYARSKVLTDQDVAALADERFSPTFLRHATAYGDSPRLRLDLVVNDFVANAFVHGRILLKSDGSAWRPLVHVEDIASAFLAVLEAPRQAVHNQAFNVGCNAENYRIIQVAEIVRDVIPGTRLEFAPGASADKRCYRVDFSKIARVLPNLKFQWNVDRGARQLYDAFRASGLTADILAGPSYFRLAALRELRQQGALNGQLRWQTPTAQDAGAEVRR